MVQEFFNGLPVISDEDTFEFYNGLPYVFYDYNNAGNVTLGSAYNYSSSRIGQNIGFVQSGAGFDTVSPPETFATIFSSPTPGSSISLNVLLKSTKIGSVWMGIYSVTGSVPANLLISGATLLSSGTEAKWYEISGMSYALPVGSYAVAFSVI